MTSDDSMTGASATGSGSTLDSVFSLARDYIRTRYSRPPDPSQQGPQAVAIPSAATVSTPPAEPRNGLMPLSMPVVLFSLAALAALVVVLSLKKG